MRKEKKKLILEFIRALQEAHKHIESLHKKNDAANAAELLRQCQESALQISNLIVQFEGEDLVADRLLEDYCESVYSLWEQITTGKKFNSRKPYQIMQKKLIQAEKHIKDNIREHIEVVFLPYKAAMWDSLESVWQAADADENCDAFVIPIPYFGRDDKGKPKDEHWEGNQFPDYVPITHYEEYDFKNNHPDMIFIHNPYDGTNAVTTVHPYFYSENLKKFTDKLIYIPYFSLGKINPESEEAIAPMRHYCTLPGVINSDKTIVESEDMRRIYIDVLTEENGAETQHIWEKKILGLGSPKIDKILNTNRDNLEIPESWKKIIYKPDGTRKKIIFYNIGFHALEAYQEKWLEKIRNVLKTFREQQDDVALLWRPHPLIQTMMQSLFPELLPEYQEIVTQYCGEGWGIYDDTPDVDRAVAVCDGYYGDGSSVIELCQAAGKPVMIQTIRET